MANEEAFRLKQENSSFTSPDTTLLKCKSYKNLSKTVIRIKTIDKEKLKSQVLKKGLATSPFNKRSKSQ